MAFSINETTALSAIQSGNILSIIGSLLVPSYGIYNQDGSKAITPSSFISLEYAGDATVTTAPIELGSYSSYNKVLRPAEIRVTFAFEGWSAYSGSIPNIDSAIGSFTSRTDILNILEAMRTTPKMYDVETPDKTFLKYDLTHYNYGVKATSGVTLLIAELIFQAILDVAEVTYSNSNSTSAITSNGTSKSPMAVTDPAGTASSSTSLLSEAKSAYASITKSISSAATSAMSDVTKVINGVTSASATVTSAVSSTASSIESNATISKIVSGLT